MDKTREPASGTWFHTEVGSGCIFMIRTLCRVSLQKGSCSSFGVIFAYSCLKGSCLSRPSWGIPCSFGQRRSALLGSSSSSFLLCSWPSLPVFL